MPPKVLTNDPNLTDAQLNEALEKLPPLDDNVLMVLRHLNARIATLEAAP